MVDLNKKGVPKKTHDNPENEKDPKAKEDATYLKEHPITADELRYLRQNVLH